MSLLKVNGTLFSETLECFDDPVSAWIRKVVWEMHTITYYVSIIKKLPETYTQIEYQEMHIKFWALCRPNNKQRNNRFFIIPFISFSVHSRQVQPHHTDRAHLSVTFSFASFHLKNHPSLPTYFLQFTENTYFNWFELNERLFVTFCNLWHKQSFMSSRRKKWIPTFLLSFL